MTRRKIEKLLQTVRSDRFTLSMILIGGLALRFFLVPFRWINPDEGAHLLGARLLLQGLMPVADFGSRQPLYVAVIALFLKLGGIHLWVGRLMPVFASIGVSVALFLLGKRLFDARAGLIAAAIYAFLPLTLIWSTVVKTEPLTIFFGCVSMLLLVGSLMDQKPSSLLFSGVFAAFAFYVRQPALYLPIATVLFLLIRRERRLRNLALYAGGYLLVVILVFLIFSSRMTFAKILVSQLNPTTLVLSRFYHLLGIAPEAFRFVDSSGFRVLDQSMDYTLLSWQQAVSFTAAATLPAIALLIFSFTIKERLPQTRLLFFLWAGVVLLLYAFQTANRGFYTQYFTEVLPPLILLTSAVVVRFFAVFPRRKMLHLTVPLFYFIFLTQRVITPWQAGQAAQMMTALALAVVTLMLLFYRRHFAWVEISSLLLPMIVVGGIYLTAKLLGAHSFICLLASLTGLMIFLRVIGKKSGSAVLILGLLLFGFFLSAVSSGAVVGLRYEAVWSPQTLAGCVKVLREQGQPDDQVLSGAGIWTFESGLQPFLNVPHPTELLRHKREDFEIQFGSRPPQFIILDGYTHRKFIKYWEFIEERIAIDYEPIAVIDGSKYPVEIYRYKAGTRPLPNLMSEVKR